MWWWGMGRERVRKGTKIVCVVVLQYPTRCLIEAGKSTEPAGKARPSTRPAKGSYSPHGLAWERCAHAERDPRQSIVPRVRDVSPLIAKPSVVAVHL